MNRATTATDADAGATAADRLPIIAIDLPVLYEDEGQEEMGESDIHTLTDLILFTALRAHLASRPEYRVFSNLNLHYHRLDRNAYVSPDEMIVVPARALAEPVRSYRIGDDGPAPVLTIEILSRRSAQQQDLTNKPVIYADQGVGEYILVDAMGEFLAEKLLLKERQADGNWRDRRDPDGGVTSQLGFRIIMEADGLPRVLHAVTGQRYLRPDEAQAEAEARRQADEERRKADQARRQADEERRRADEARGRAEDRVRELEAELARLREARHGGSGNA